MRSPGSRGFSSAPAAGAAPTLVGFSPHVANQLATCYRHPGRETGVRCQRCERPICPACMVPAPVGVQCVECVRRARPHVPPGQSLRRAASGTFISYGIIGVNVAVWLLGLLVEPQAILTGSPLAPIAGLFGPAVAAGEWWRLFTAGFLHSGLIHLGLNMVVLYLLGPPLERALGRLAFVSLYMAGLTASSMGALLLSPHSLTVGASGAIFALMGATIVGQRAAGINPWRSGIIGWVIINLVFTVTVPGISIGGHLGGLAGGLIAGAVLFRPGLRPALASLACVGLAGAFAAASLVVAGSPVR
jgi:membrane associated rhomboid family serine protease